MAYFLLPDITLSGLEWGVAKNIDCTNSSLQSIYVVTAPELTTTGVVYCAKFFPYSIAVCVEHTYVCVVEGASIIYSHPNM